MVKTIKLPKNSALAEFFFLWHNSFMTFEPEEKDAVVVKTWPTCVQIVIEPAEDAIESF